MKLTTDFKNIVKLRFNQPEKLGVDFFDTYYKGVETPSEFDGHSFADLSLKDTLGYLQKSHTEYLNLWLPKIEGSVQEIKEVIGVNDISLTLKAFVVNYSNELRTHINFEERVLYNFVEKLLNGKYVEKEKVFVLNHFLETHNHHISDDLEKIQKVIKVKEPDIDSNEMVTELFEQLNLIHNDLEVHGVVEDNIFIEKIHQYIAENYS